MSLFFSFTSKHFCQLYPEKFWKTGSYWGFTFYVHNYWCRKFGYQGLAKCSSRIDVTSLCQTAHEFILIYYTVVESQNVPKKEFQAENWWNDTSCWVKSYKNTKKNRNRSFPFVNLCKYSKFRVQKKCWYKLKFIKCTYRH